MGAVATVVAVGSLLTLFGLIVFLALWRKAEEREAGYELELRIGLPSPTLKIRVEKKPREPVSEAPAPVMRPSSSQVGDPQAAPSEKGKQLHPHEQQRV
jgi:hypothetical protein